jgi:hypothetical protein
MREMDQSAMLADLRADVDRLQSELNDQRTRPGGAGSGSRGGSRLGADADVLVTLFVGNLALAAAKDE